MPGPITILKDNVALIEKAIRDLAKKQVLVGIPENKTTRALSGIQETITNAALGYIHENGSPAQNIPARPWLAPSVLASKDQTVKYFEQVGKLALEGEKAKAIQILNIAGQYNVNSIKTRITAGIPPPLKRPRRAPGNTPVARARARKVRALTGGQETPLIDTAQFLNSITYVIRDKK